MQRVQYIILPNLLLPFLVIAPQTNVSISIGASLTAIPIGKPWLSSSGEFALGFQQVQGKDNFLLSIWYEKIPEKTIIWYPEGGPALPAGSKVELTNGLGLVLSDPQGRNVWSTGPASDITYGVMNDTGKFVIVGNNSRKIWESFNFPTDTMLPTQCECPRGFSLLDPSDPNGDCKPYFFPSYEEGESKVENFEFVELMDIDWPTSDYVITTTKSALETWGNKCWKKKLPLYYRKVDYSVGVKVFVKFLKGDLPPGSPPRFSGENNNRRSLIIAGSALFGTYVFVNIVLFVEICFGIFLIYKKKHNNT
ncbi:bulb-type lectin domain-containing protein [Artemisia annua]|uniref:Bulb-type lectin domain-containing protein n=1 Tax=Artemisia annua TaxID=35608 RepID=A0A2U1KD96_ARTAN|nr:bulb-type lectin domain-containing protein [Artemisia annua]